jgi:DNA-binding MarR family transcriptional regulator
MPPRVDEPIPQVPAERLTEQVSELGRRLTAFLEEQISALELTVPQAMLLRSLDGPLPMNQLASRLHCDASNVTGIVDRLEARKLVERRVKPGDRRIKEIVLTPEGKRVRRRIAATTSSVPGLSRLSRSDQRALGELLTRALADR